MWSSLPKWGVRIPLQILLWTLTVITVLHALGLPTQLF